MSSVYLRAAGVLLAVLVLAGCGGGDGEEPQKVAETADLTQYEVASLLGRRPTPLGDGQRRRTP
jgi:hypothetical protein